MQKLKTLHNMETIINDEHFNRLRIKSFIDSESVEDILQNFLEGEVIFSYNKEILKSHDILFMIIHNPRYHITSEQLCQIMDEENHCISNGSIIYEADYCYITWSNHGHI